MYVSSLSVRAAKTLARLRRCAASSESTGCYHNLLNWLKYRFSLSFLSASAISRERNIHKRLIIDIEWASSVHFSGDSALQADWGNYKY